MKQLLLMICLVCASILSVTSSEMGTREMQKANGNVPVRGGLGGIKRMGAGQPVTVTQNPSNIEITFSSNLGSLTVTVVNKQNYPVYQQTVDAIAGSTLTVDTSSWSNGNYIIMITNSTGGCLEGEFTK